MKLDERVICNNRGCIYDIMKGGEGFSLSRDGGEKIVNKRRGE